MVTHGGNLFALARQHGWDWREVADFSASINPLGPSPKVRDAITQALDRIAHYPDAYSCAVQHALAEHWQVDPATLMMGNGATDLLHFFARSIEAKRVYLAAPVFSEFHRAFPDASIVPFDSARWPADGLVVVTRPANPTGKMPDLDAYLASTVNPVLVDESFIEFTGEASLLDRIATRPNLFVLRSLTKFYAIPGLRAGALAGPPELMAQWRRRREPWQLNVLAEVSVLAAIEDSDHARRSVEFVRSERAWLASALSAIPGVAPRSSVANYLLLALDRPAAEIAARLEQKKILVRDCSAWPGVSLANALRVAVRPRTENVRLVAELRGALCEL